MQQTVDAKVHTNFLETAPILPGLPGWNASVDCIFHPDHVARFFDRELEAAKETFEAA